MLGLSWEPVGVSSGDLEPSWVELEVVVGGFGGTSIFHALGKHFWNKRAPRGRHFGSQSGAKIDLGSFLSPLPSSFGLLFLSSLSFAFFFSFHFSFSAPSWPPLGLHFGPSWAPKLAPCWPNMRPSRLLKPHFFPKLNFQKNERHSAWEHDFDPKAGLKTAQDRPKIAPRQFQDAL